MRTLRTGVVLHLLFVGHNLSPLQAQSDNSKPNIIYILCDDLGYGDPGCFNPQSKIATPHLDQLAKEGRTFTDMHSGSAVCTPTRYGILTGRYAWRTRLKQGVLGGLSPHLIHPDRLTVPSLLKSHGYHTACIGKWHLGVDWEILPGKEISELSIETPDQVNGVDYSKPVRFGPTKFGFDQYFGISGSLDMVPYAFIDNDRLIALPVAQRDFPMVLGRKGARTRLGPAAEVFEAEDVLPTLTNKAIEYVEQVAAAARSGKPFFLYLPLASPHTPIAPSTAWQGKSQLTPYADFVMQTDDCIGQLLRTIDDLKLANNTLVIITSDNGFAPAADLQSHLAKGHNPSFVFRGTKADIFEGGHRIPFIVRWPSHVPPGSTSNETRCLTDLLATVADILDIELPENAGEDSVSMLGAMTGKPNPSPRKGIIHHSVDGSFAIRQGDYKLIFAPDSGGWSSPRPGKDNVAGLPSLQLYNLRDDVGETINLVDRNPEIVEQLSQTIERIIREGRSTPGPPQSNDRKVSYRRGEAES